MGYVLRDALDNMQSLIKLNLQCHIVRLEGIEIFWRSVSKEFVACIKGV